MLDANRSVASAVAALGAGEMIVVMDDRDREDEADLFVGASLCTPDQMAFIIRHTSGIVCAPMAADQARRLSLPLMVSEGDAPLGTAFTISIDAREGLSTGISAKERANTVRTLASPTSVPGDFVRPGHVFPLVAKDGGVLMRSGHTEACVDLCQMAGLLPVGVLSELMNDDGSVMRGAEVREFAARHGLKVTSISDLIAHRQARERLVKKVGEFPVASRIGVLDGHAFRSPFDPQVHMAFVYGDIGDGRNVLTRLHRADLINEVFGGARIINNVLDRFRSEGRGVIVYLRDGAAGVPVAPLPTAATNSESARLKHWREIGVGAQILMDLGITSIRLLTSSQTTYVGLSGFNIEIVGTEALS